MVPLVPSEWMSRLLIQCSRQPSLSYIYNDLLNFEGCEFHKAPPYAELTGKMWKDVCNLFGDECLPVGFYRHREHDDEDSFMQKPDIREKSEVQDFEPTIEEVSCPTSGIGMKIPGLSMPVNSDSNEIEDDTVYMSSIENEAWSMKCVLNPDPNSILEEGDLVIVIAEDDSHIRLKDKFQSVVVSDETPTETTAFFENKKSYNSSEVKNEVRIFELPDWKPSKPAVRHFAFIGYKPECDAVIYVFGDLHFLSNR